MKWLALMTLTALSLACVSSAQESKPLYKNDFQQATVGQLPEDLAVLDGSFTVQEEQGNKFLELPGAPLDSFGVLFGPTEKENTQASARVFGASRGRRFPTFALGLNGMAGYRVQVSPGKKLLELYRGDTLKTTAAFVWTSGKWAHLRLQVTKTAGQWHVQAKAWMEGQAEPNAWTIAIDDPEDLPAGRAVIFGSPFAGTPIRFDDLIVERVTTSSKQQ